MLDSRLMPFGDGNRASTLITGFSPFAACATTLFRGETCAVLCVSATCRSRNRSGCLRYYAALLLITACMVAALCSRALAPARDEHNPSRTVNLACLSDSVSSALVLGELLGVAHSGRRPVDVENETWIGNMSQLTPLPSPASSRRICSRQQASRTRDIYCVTVGCQRKLHRQEPFWRKHSAAVTSKAHHATDAKRFSLADAQVSSNSGYQRKDNQVRPYPLSKVFACHIGLDARAQAVTQLFLQVPSEYQPFV